MKKSLVALSVLGAMTGLAHADDTSVTLYGVLDIGVATTTNVAGTAAVKAIAANPAKYQLAVPAVPAGTSGTVTGLQTGGMATSRWGLRGTEDLGDGTKVKFLLESELLPATGQTLASDPATASSTQLFKRGAWVGLAQDGLGEVRFGRQNTATYDYVTTYDALPAYNVGSLATNVDGNKAAGGGAFNSYVLDRYDGGVQLRSADLSGLNLRAGWAFGNFPGSQGQGRVFDLGAAYHLDALNLAVAYLSKNNNVASDTSTATTNFGVFATYDFTVAIINASYTNSKGKLAGGDSFTTATIGARVPLTPKFTLIGEFARDNNKQTGNKPHIFSGGLTYGLSKRTSVYGLAAFASQQGTSQLETASTSKFYTGNGLGIAPIAGDNQTTVMVGINHKF
jgi:predicted porin